MSLFDKQCFAFRAPPRNNKFWTAEVVGHTVFVTYGKIGSHGATQVKEFGSRSEADAFVRGKVREKTREGYEREGASHPGAPTAQLQAARAQQGLGGGPAAAARPAAHVPEETGVRHLDM